MGAGLRFDEEEEQGPYLVRLRRAFHSQSKLLKVPSNLSRLNCPGLRARSECQRPFGGGLPNKRKPAGEFVVPGAKERAAAAVSATPWHFVPSGKEVAHALIDVAVDAAGDRPARSIGEVHPQSRTCGRGAGPGRAAGDTIALQDG
jgi:hypothetical protein